MKYIISLILLILISDELSAQIDNPNSFEHGLVVCARIDSDDDFNFNIKGFGIEGGYYISKGIGKRGELSIDFRLAYSKSTRSYQNIGQLDEVQYLINDSILTLRNGIVFYNNISLSTPIKYRFHLGKQGFVFLLAGYNPYFSLANNSTWEYDEVEYDRKNDIIVSEIINQEEELVQKFYSSDLFAGIGFKKDNAMIELYFSAGAINFKNDFINAAEKISLVLNFYYRIN